MLFGGSFSLSFKASAVSALKTLKRSPFSVLEAYLELLGLWKSRYKYYNGIRKPTVLRVLPSN